jgi:hypothetical protein
MKMLDFQAQMNPDGTLTVPPQLVQQIGEVRLIRVVLVLAESSEEEDWARVTREQFLRGYSEDDDVYDQLSVG